MDRTPPRDWLAAVSGWHERTVRRHEAAGTWPAWVRRLLRLELEGELEGIHAAWAAWTISRAGELVAPSGTGYRPGEVLSIQLRHQQIRALKKELVELRQRLAELEHVGTGDRELELAAVGQR